MSYRIMASKFGVMPIYGGGIIDKMLKRLNGVPRIGRIIVLSVVMTAIMCFVWGPLAVALGVLIASHLLNEVLRLWQERKRKRLGYERWSGVFRGIKMKNEGSGERRKTWARIFSWIREAGKSLRHKEKFGEIPCESCEEAST